MGTQAQSAIHLPRVEIKFCVQCKWNLRAAYYAQELLQTFSNTLGEIALVPVTGGTFTITLQHAIPPPDQSTTTATNDHPTPTAKSRSLSSSIGNVGAGPFALTSSTPSPLKVTTTQVWDRKTDGGFPETKELKNRIRNLVDPQRDMGHIDRSLNKGKTTTTTSTTNVTTTATLEEPPQDSAFSLSNTNISSENWGNSSSFRISGGAVGSNSGIGDHHGAAAYPDRKTYQQDFARKREAGLGEDEDDGDSDDEAGMHDCEECRLAAREALEDQIGRVTSRY